MSDKKMTSEDVERFRKVFGGPPPIDFLMSLDVVAVDRILHQKFGYDEEEHGSMMDFMTFKWGEDFSNFVRGLLGKTLDLEQFTLRSNL